MSLRNFSFIVLFMGFGALACAQAPATNAQSPSQRHERGMFMMPLLGMPSDQEIDQSLTKLQTTLNLSPVQVNNIRQLSQKRRDEMRSIREQARPKFRQLMTLLNQSNPDPAVVGRATLELKAIHDQAVTKQSAVEKELTTILNPTQQQTVNNLRREAETFMALRRIGLIEPDFVHGMFMSGMKTPVNGAGHLER